jgi:hypothetical protein
MLGYLVRNGSHSGPKQLPIIVSERHMVRFREIAARATISGHESKRKTRKLRFSRFTSTTSITMKLPGAPRQPLGEVSPNQRSRVVGARDHGISVSAIGRMELLTNSTCRSILRNTHHQVSCITPSRPGQPQLLTLGNERIIQRAIVVNPKITAQQLFITCAPHTSKKTIY